MMEGVRFESNGSPLHHCKIFARIHSLTEMSRDRNGQTESARRNRPDRIGQTVSARSNGPDRIGQAETAQTEMAQTKTDQTETTRPKRPDRKVLFRVKSAMA